MGRIIEAAEVAEDRGIMEQLLASGHIEHKYAVRLQTVLHRLDGKSPTDIAKYLGININTVTAYVKRYNATGLDSLLRDKTRKPGTPPVSEEIKNKVRDIACHEKPKNATHWSTRTLAKRVGGISHNKVSEILRESGIKPHIQSYYSYSNDPQFETKLRDVVGLYMNPPDNALILCVDEKSQIQALERAQHTLFPQRNLPSHQSNDYYRHGTTTLFTALDYLTGKVIGDCKNTHNSEDYLKFIKKLNRQCEKGKTLHIIADNYKTHKSKLLIEYLEKHPGRFVLHFTPTHSSWLNLVERFFREITTERIRRESWNSVDELIRAIKAYINNWNKSDRKFRWSKSGDIILQNIKKHKGECSSA
ncbi:MAG: IS630-like element ISMsm2 family transposase [Treponemataceae bacterium]|nr:MAG: IS630-like element ISMsm2 family transposase [Treponemataceae bacterium]